MAKQVRVLLLENVSSIGSAGEIVSVSEGYARNFLFPQAKAAMATPDVQNEYEHRQASTLKAAEEQLKSLQEKADSLEGTELVMPARIKEDGELYGSIGKKEVAEELSKQTGFNLKPQNIILEAPIKKIGGNSAVVQFSPDVEAKILVTIVSEEESQKS